MEDCEPQKICRYLGSAPNLMACHGSVWGLLNVDINDGLMMIENSLIWADQS